MRTRKIIIAIVSLLLGCLIYFVSDLHLMCNNIYFIRNYLPDFLWCFSFYNFVSLIISKMSRNYVLLSSLYVFVFSIGFEWLQYRHFVKGTFDCFDIVTYAMAIILAALSEYILWRKEK